MYDPTCVVKVQPDDNLISIAARVVDETVDPETIKAENGLASNVINLGQLLDVCVDNGINDVTGEARGERNAVIVQREVMAQQAKLNELFAGYGIRELLIDGVSGPVTRQRLCAFRLAAGLPVSTADMIGGSDEEQAMMATTVLPIPFTSAILAERWVLIDRTCQIMFVGEGTQKLQFVFPTSTGQPGFETRDRDPVAGIQVRPGAQQRRLARQPHLSGGGGQSAQRQHVQAALLRPRPGDPRRQQRADLTAEPRVRRLRVEHMDMLLAWLGLADASGPVGSRDRINLTVNVQGTWRG